jgi:hypothetical protein
MELSVPIAGSEYMSIIDHLTDIRCPNCSVQLFRALDPLVGVIVFCSECLVGGRFTAVAKQRGALTGNFITRQSADDYLREIRSGGQYRSAPA